MAKLQPDSYERGYFHKIWMDYYCLGENDTSGTLKLVSIFYQIFVFSPNDSPLKTEK